MEIKPVNVKGNRLWIFIGRTDAEAEALVFWSPDVNSRLIGKVPDVGKDWGLEKVMTGWDGWMASLAQWTWVWANSQRWRRTRKPGVLQSIELQTLGHGRATKEQYLGLLPIFWLNCLLFDIKLYELFVWTIWVLTTCYQNHLQIFSPIPQAAFLFCWLLSLQFKNL